MKKISFLTFLFLIFLTLGIPNTYASPGLIARGLAKTLFSAFQIPVSMLRNAPRAFPLGLVYGAVEGTAKTVVGTVSGVVDIARGAAPYAKYGLLFI